MISFVQIINKLNKKTMTLEQEFKEKVGFDAYENNQMQPKVYNESYVEWLEAKINYTRCCKSDSEQLKHDDLEIGKQVEIDLTFTEKHIGKIVSIGKDKVKVENNDWTYDVSKQNITKVF